MVPKRISPLWALWLSLLMAIPLSGQTPEPGTDSLVAISLTDGTQLKGSIIQEDEDHIVVMTASGLEVKVPASRSSR